MTSGGKKINALAAVRMMALSDDDEDDEEVDLPAHQKELSNDEFLLMHFESTTPTKPLRSILKKKSLDTIKPTTERPSKDETRTVCEPALKVEPQLPKTGLAAPGLAQALMFIKENKEDLTKEITAEDAKHLVLESEQNEGDLLQNSQVPQDLKSKLIKQEVDHSSMCLDGEQLRTEDSKSEAPLAHIKTEPKTMQTAHITEHQNLRDNVKVISHEEQFKSDDLSPIDKFDNPNYGVVPSEVKPEVGGKRIIMKISGLPITNIKKDLITFLGVDPKNGEDGICLVCDLSGDPSGTAFLELSGPNDMTKVLQASGTLFQKQILKVEQSSPNEMELGQKMTLCVKKQLKKSPFVKISNVPFISTKHDLMVLLSVNNWRVKDVYCKSYKPARGNDGYALAHLENAEMAEEFCKKTLHFNSRTLLARKIHPEYVIRYCQTHNFSLEMNNNDSMNAPVNVLAPKMEFENQIPSQAGQQKIKDEGHSGDISQSDLIVDKSKDKLDSQASDNVKNPTTDDGAVINADPQSTVFVYDPGNIDSLVIPQVQTDEEKIKKEKKGDSSTSTKLQLSSTQSKDTGNTQPTRPQMPPGHPGMGMPPRPPGMGMRPGMGPNPMVMGPGPPRMGPGPAHMGPGPLRMGPGQPWIGPRPRFGPDPMMMARGPMMGPGPMGPRPGAPPMMGRPPMFHQGPPGQRPLMPGPGGFGPSVYVRMYNLPEQATTDDIRDFLAPIHPAKIAQNIGYNIVDVDFYTPDDAMNALRRHGMLIRKNAVAMELLPGPPVPLPPRIGVAKAPKKRRSDPPPLGAEHPPPPARKFSDHSRGDERPKTRRNGHNSGHRHKKEEPADNGFDVDRDDEKGEKIHIPPFPDDPFRYRLPAYDANNPAGQCAIKAMEGYFCQICRKFYSTQQAGQVVHCKSKGHYDKLKLHLEALKQKRNEMMELGDG